jgi:hypothetical protein
MRLFFYANVSLAFFKKNLQVFCCIFTSFENEHFGENDITFVIGF